jgi:hypothetical protein
VDAHVEGGVGHGGGAGAFVHFRYWDGVLVVVDGFYRGEFGLVWFVVLKQERLKCFYFALFI